MNHNGNKVGVGLAISFLKVPIAILTKISNQLLRMHAMFTTKSFAIIYLWLTLESFKKIGAMACCHDKLGMWVNMSHNIKGSFLLSAGPCAGTT